MRNHGTKKVDTCITLVLVRVFYTPLDTTNNRYGTVSSLNGLKTVTETPEGDEASDSLCGQSQYLTLMSARPSSLH